LGVITLPDDIDNLEAGAEAVETKYGRLQSG
jgi:hypothetical protein